MLSIPTSWVEEVYTRGLYPELQARMTPLSNRTGFAWLDAAGGVLLLILAVSWSTRLARSHGRRVMTLVRLSTDTIVLGATLYLMFVVLWGLNYRREPLTARLDFAPARVSHEALLNLARSTVGAMNELASPAARDPLILDAAPDLLGPAFERALERLGQRPAVPGRPKRSILNFYFQRAAVDGMLDPYFLEVLVRDDLLPFERPFAVAHEWAHLAGFADESEASFVGWLTCMYANQPAQYSAWLYLYLQTLDDLDEGERTRLVAGLADAPRADLDALARKYDRQVWPIARDLGTRVYDRFLKANQVEAGVRSYDAVVTLVLGARFAGEYEPVLRRPGAD